MAIGFVFPSLFVVKEDADPGQQNIDNARQHIHESQFWQAVVGLIVLVLLLLFLKEKPKTPPSASSDADE